MCSGTFGVWGNRWVFLLYNTYNKYPKSNHIFTQIYWQNVLNERTIREGIPVGIEKFNFSEVCMCEASFGHYEVLITVFLSVLQLEFMRSRYGPSNNLKGVIYKPLWLISTHLYHLSVWEFERSELAAEPFLSLRSAYEPGIHAASVR